MIPVGLTRARRFRGSKRRKGRWIDRCVHSPGEIRSWRRVALPPFPCTTYAVKRAPPRTPVSIFTRRFAKILFPSFLPSTLPCTRCVGWRGYLCGQQRGCLPPDRGAHGWRRGVRAVARIGRRDELRDGSHSYLRLCRRAPSRGARRSRGCRGVLQGEFFFVLFQMLPSPPYSLCILVLYDD